MLFLRPLSDLGLINENSTYRWCFNKKENSLRQNTYEKTYTQNTKHNLQNHEEN